jgi:hypothetical protein
MEDFQRSVLDAEGRVLRSEDIYEISSRKLISTIIPADKNVKKRIHSRDIPERDEPQQKDAIGKEEVGRETNVSKWRNSRRIYLQSEKPLKLPEG